MDIESLPDIDLRKSCCSLGLGVKKVLRVVEPFLTRTPVTLLTGEDTCEATTLEVVGISELLSEPGIDTE